jgi:RNA 2',3'-cyclic 3'-phosphodiesterase
MIRSFVAINLPPATQDALTKVSQRLRRRAPYDSVRWSRVSGIHLTLKFLGDVAPSDLPEIKSVLAEVGARHTRFRFTVGGVGCFPNVRRPQVVWVGLEEESGVLAALQRDVEQSLAPLGFAPEKRAFHPHLTLGRTVRNVRPTDLRRLGELIATAGVGELGHVHVNAFHLMRSDLRPRGAIYTALAAFALEAPA